jgi:tRNA 2-thiouridine synthesizing protein A
VGEIALRDGVAVVDTRGLYCAGAVVRIDDRIKALPPGGVLEVLSDDPVILEDLPAFCRSHGHEYLGHMEEAGGVLRVRLRRPEKTVGR